MKKYKNLGVILFGLVCFFGFNLSVDAATCDKDNVQKALGITIDKTINDFGSGTYTICYDKDKTFNIGLGVAQGVGFSYTETVGNKICNYYGFNPDYLFRFDIKFEGDNFKYKYGNKSCTVTKNTIIKFKRSGTGSVGIIPNSNYDNAICKAVRGEVISYDNFKKLWTSSSSGRNKQKINDKMIDQDLFIKYIGSVKNNFNYCTSTSVNYNYSIYDLGLIVQNIIKYLEARDVASNQSTSYDQEFIALMNQVPVENRKKDNNGNISIKNLTCDPFSLEPIEGDSYYTNKNMYSNTSQKNISVGDGYTCKKECTEVVTVKYGPPVASKAGQCFEYKVKVESKTQCIASLDGASVPTLTVPTICTPTAECNATDFYADQGGPSEDFDNCVSACDGGAYSQKCINKCYDKVYSSSKTNKLSFSYDTKGVVKKLENKVNVNPTQAQINALDDLAKKIYDAKQKNPGGNYERKNNSIVWEKNNSPLLWWDDYEKEIKATGTTIKKTEDINDDLNSLGYYYFSTLDLTKRTIYGLLGFTWCNSNGFCDNLGPYISANGFKAAWNCTEECSWIGCSGREIDTTSIENYRDSIDNYIDAVNSCTNESVCTTETAEFEISADNKVKNGDNVKTSYDKAIVYSNGNIVDKSGLITRTVDDNGKTLDLIGIGGYCYTKKEQWLDHMTEWSFPRVWFDNKISNLVFKEPSNIAAYDFVGNLYCSSPKSVDVNKKWDNWKKFYYDYYKLSNKNVPALTEVQKTNITKDINNNITATSKDFGYFKWDFDIKCFYSIVNDPIVPPGDPDNPDDPICTEEECPVVTCKDDDCDQKIDMDNYKYRNVSTSDLFPGEDREAGFNWSSGATNINNSNYEITPVGLQAAIEDRQNEIYSADKEEEYLDYQFILDKDTINMIRELNNDQKNYTKYVGENVVKDGIIFYRSSLLRDQLKQKNGNNILPDLGCNNIGVNGCERFYDDTANNLRLTNSKREGA